MDVLHYCNYLRVQYKVPPKNYTHGSYIVVHCDRWFAVDIVPTNGVHSVRYGVNQ